MFILFFSDNLKLPMNFNQIAIHIKETYLKPLEEFEIKNLEDVRDFHEELIKVRVDLFAKGGPQVMPQYRGEQNYGWDI